MTKKGVAAYRRANSGSKLKTAVTGRLKRSKAAKRRKSFCAQCWSDEEVRKRPRTRTVVCDSALREVLMPQAVKKRSASGQPTKYKTEFCDRAFDRRSLA